MTSRGEQMQTRFENTPSPPPVVLPDGSRKRHLTGSLLYQFLTCEHACALELFGDPSRKRAPSPGLELLLRRGREHEDRIVAELDWSEPDYEDRDWAQGAERTIELMRQGAALIYQGVLFGHGHLGIPDLMRREPGASVLGDYHYVIGDIKSSRRSRADQAVQVAFYSRQLERVQERRPEYAYLVLREGNEARIDLRDVDAVLDEVFEELRDLIADEQSSRPHRSIACRTCAWRDVCAESPDVHWVPGLTRSVRALIEEAGHRRLDSLARVEPRAMARQTGLPEATWQRARWGAESVLAQRAIQVRSPRRSELVSPIHSVVVLRDEFDQRSPVFASRPPGGPSRVHVAKTLAAERDALAAMLTDVSGAKSLCHSGRLGDLLYELGQRMPEMGRTIATAEQLTVDLMGIARGTWVFPEPVGSPEDAVAWILGREPAEPTTETALLLAEQDWDGLVAMAEAQLVALEQLAELVGQAS